jgi:hypothetical protein
LLSKHWGMVCNNRQLHALFAAEVGILKYIPFSNFVWKITLLSMIKTGFIYIGSFLAKELNNGVADIYAEVICETSDDDDDEQL